MNKLTCWLAMSCTRRGNGMKRFKCIGGRLHSMNGYTVLGEQRAIALLHSLPKRQ